MGLKEELLAQPAVVNDRLATQEAVAGRETQKNQEANDMGRPRVQEI